MTSTEDRVTRGRLLVRWDTIGGALRFTDLIVGLNHGTLELKSNN